MEIIRPKSKQPMPATAKRVFKGAIFDVYQWEQEGYDGSTHIFEKLKRPDTVVILALTPDNKIIITDQEQPGKKPFVGLLGGRVNEGEDILAAAKREMLEESGYTSETWELLEAMQPVGKVDWAVFIFIARNSKKVQEQDLDGAEKIDLRFVDYDEFLKLVFEPDFYEGELRTMYLEAKGDSEKTEALRKRILGNS